MNSPNIIFFSEDYLMHYGVKGMKWKHHKRNTRMEGELIDDFHITPAEKEEKPTYTFSPHPAAYVDAAYGMANGYYLSDANTPTLLWNNPAADYERANIRRDWTNYRRNQEQTPEGKRRVDAIRQVADAMRQRDIEYIRTKEEQAYYKNQKRITKQQKRAKVKNSIKRAKNRVISGPKKAKDVVSNIIRKHRRKR